MKTGIVIVLALLMLLAIVPLPNRGGYFLQVYAEDDESKLSITIEEAKDESFPLVTKFPGFNIKQSFTDKDGDEWDVYGFFLFWKEDAPPEGPKICGHKWDIEGVLIFKNRRTGKVVSASLAHYYIYFRLDPKIHHFFAEEGKHGLWHEKGEYLPEPWLQFVSWYILKKFGMPYVANGGGKIYNSAFFQDQPTFSGISGAQELRMELKEFLDDVPQYEAIWWSRVNLIIQILSDGGETLNSILESALRGQETWNITDWNKKNSEWGGVDFSSIELTYISEHLEEEQEEPLLDFQYMLRATEAKPGDEIIDFEEAEALALQWFLIGLSLPDDRFWVNLNPWEADRIIDEDLGRTDLGRIMLEADFQMKKDFCKYQNPCESDAGERYWNMLEGKREELVRKCMNMYPGEIENVQNVLFAASTRHWIVPDKITGYGDGDEFYIDDATLSIFSEPVFEHSTFEIVNQLGTISEGCSASLSDATEEYGKYVKELEEEMILPLVVEEVNTNSSYSNLRQVYCSLALAQWYKSRYRHGGHLFSDFIDSENLENLESKVSWSPEEIWTEYVQSYEEGEFYCEKEYQEGDYIITKIYTAGGVDFLNIMEKISVIGSIDSEINEIVSETRSKPLVERNGMYYYGDYVSGSYDSKDDTGFSIDSIIQEYFEPIINTTKSILEKYYGIIICICAIVIGLVFVIVRLKRGEMREISPH